MLVNFGISFVLFWERLMWTCLFSYYLRACRCTHAAISLTSVCMHIHAHVTHPAPVASCIFVQRLRYRAHMHMSPSSRRYMHAWLFAFSAVAIASWTCTCHSSSACRYMHTCLFAFSAIAIDSCTRKRIPCSIYRYICISKVSNFASHVCLSHHAWRAYFARAVTPRLCLWYHVTHQLGTLCRVKIVSCTCAVASWLAR